jgi:hypothetical protein
MSATPAIPRVLQPPPIILGAGPPSSPPTTPKAFFYDTVDDAWYMAVSGAWVTTAPSGLIGLLLDYSIPGNFWLM